MIRKLFLLLAILSCVFTYSWEDYKKQFGKKYSTASQDSIHEAAFNASMDYINEINSQNLDYKLHPTKWSDKPSEQIRQTVKVSLSKDNLSPKTSITKNGYQGLEGGVKVSAPTSLDWRNSSKVTPIRDQEACGCCWAFTTAAVAQSLFLINNNTNITSSVEYLLECTNSSGCDGGYVNIAMRQALLYGLPADQKYPYTSADGFKSSTPGICKSSADFKKFPTDTITQNYYNLTNNQMKTLVATSPFVALIAADTGFMNYGSGIYSCNFTATQVNINHAVVVVGYDSNGNYLIKNSWGKSWGINGFGWVNAKTTQNCAINLYAYTLVSNSFVSGTSNSSGSNTNNVTDSSLSAMRLLVGLTFIIGFFLF